MGRGSKGKAAVVPTDPITPKVVHNLLREKVLKGFVVPPKATDPSVKYLAEVLEDIRRDARAYFGRGIEEQKRAATILEALDVFETELPKFRVDYLASLKYSEGWKSAGWTAKAFHLHAKADLVKLDALIVSARAFKERGLPRYSQLFSVTIYARKWKDFARELQHIFLTALPEARKEGAYRFIMAIAPLITGETPSEKAVRTHFMHKRVDDISLPPKTRRLAPIISPPKTGVSERTRRPR